MPAGPGALITSVSPCLFVRLYPQLPLPATPTSYVFLFPPWPSLPTRLNVTMQQQKAMLFLQHLGGNFSL